MENKGHLFSFKSSGGAKGRTFYLRALNWTQACTMAEEFIEKNLDCTCWLKSVTQVADSTDMAD